LTTTLLASITLAYTKIEPMIPIKAKVKKINFDFISNFYFKFIWVILPIVFWPGLPEPLELAKVLAFIALTFIFFGYTLSIIQHPILYVKQYGIYLVLLGLLIVQVISSLTSNRPITSLLGITYRYQGLITQIAYLLFSFTVTVTALKKPKIIEHGIQYGSLIIAILTIIEAILLGSARTVGFLGNPNFTGGFLAMSLPFLGKVFLWPLPLIAIFLTGSRSALIAAGIIMLLSVIFKTRNKVLPIAAVMILTLGCIVFLPQRPTSSFDTRQTIWSKGITAAFQKPVLGWGLENFELAFNSQIKPNEFHLLNIRVDKAHNEFLEVLVNSGFIGLSLYLYLIWLILKNLRSNQKVFLSFLGFLIISNLNVVNLNEYLFFYLALGTAASLTE